MPIPLAGAVHTREIDLDRPERWLISHQPQRLIKKWLPRLISDPPNNDHKIVIRNDETRMGTSPMRGKAHLSTKSIVLEPPHIAIHEVLRA